MANVRTETFESNNTNVLASFTGGVSINTTTPHSGSYSLALSHNQSIDNAEIRASGTTYYSVATVYYLFYVLISTFPTTGDVGFVNFEDTSSNFKCGIHIDSTGKLIFYDLNGTVIGTSGTNLLAGSTYYAIQAQVGTGASTTFNVKLNGVQIFTGGTVNCGTVNNGAIKFGGNVQYAGGSFHFDDVYIDDAGYPALVDPNLLFPQWLGNHEAALPNFFAARKSYFLAITAPPEQSESLIPFLDLIVQGQFGWLAQTEAAEAQFVRARQKAALLYGGERGSAQQLLTPLDVTEAAQFGWQAQAKTDLLSFARPQVLGGQNAVAQQLLGTTDVTGPVQTIWPEEIPPLRPRRWWPEAGEARHPAQGPFLSAATIPAPINPIPTTLNTGGNVAAGTYYVKVTYTNDVGETNQPQAANSVTVTALNPPSAPSLSTSTTGGTIAAATYGVEITYTSGSGETVASASSSITTTGSTSTITVSSPASVAGATGYRVYMTAAGGSTYFTQNGGTAISLGTNYIQTAPPATFTGGPPFPGSTGQISVPSPPQVPGVTGWSAYVGTSSNGPFYKQGTNPNPIGPSLTILAFAVGAIVVPIQNTATIAGSWLLSPSAWIPPEITAPIRQRRIPSSDHAVNAFSQPQVVVAPFYDLLGAQQRPARPLHVRILEGGQTQRLDPSPGQISVTGTGTSWQIGLQDHTVIRPRRPIDSSDSPISLLPSAPLLLPFFELTTGAAIVPRARNLLFTAVPRTPTSVDGLQTFSSPELYVWPMMTTLPPRAVPRPRPSHGDLPLPSDKQSIDQTAWNAPTPVPVRARRVLPGGQFETVGSSDFVFGWHVGAQERLPSGPLGRLAAGVLALRGSALTEVNVTIPLISDAASLRVWDVPAQLPQWHRPLWLSDTMTPPTITQAGTSVVIVSGPFFVAAAAVYFAGAWQADVREE